MDEVPKKEEEPKKEEVKELTSEEDEKRLYEKYDADFKMYMDEYRKNERFFCLQVGTPCLTIAVFGGKRKNGETRYELSQFIHRTTLEHHIIAMMVSMEEIKQYVDARALDGALPKEEVETVHELCDHLNAFAQQHGINKIKLVRKEREQG